MLARINLLCPGDLEYLDWLCTKVLKEEPTSRSDPMKLARLSEPVKPDQIVPGRIATSELDVIPGNVTFIFDSINLIHPSLRDDPHAWPTLPGPEGPG